MMHIIVIAILAVSFTSAQDSHECGGTGGTDAFDDSAFAQYGEITGFRIYHGRTTCVIDGIQLRYGEVWGEGHNTKNEENEVLFGDDERITAIEMDKRNHWGFEVICQITVFTSKGVYGPYCDYDCNNNRCGGEQQGPFRYIKGRYGANLDYLEWVY